MSTRTITVVLPDPPLPDAGAAARWFYVLVRGLVERGHRVTTFAVYRQAAELNAVRDLFPAPFDVRLFAEPTASGWRSKLRTLRQPYSYPFSTELRRAVHARMAEGADVLHLEQLWTGWIGARWARCAVLHIHYLFDIDLAQAPARSLHERALRMLARGAARRLLRRYSTITTLTPRLTERVRALAPQARVATVPFAFDLSRYPFPPAAAPGGHPPTVGLIGSFDWYPNISAAGRLVERLWPRIRQQVPGARLWLVGRRAEQALARYRHLPDVTIEGDVPDVRPHFAGLDVLLYAPAAASGLKVKIVEALALGVPVVTTPDGVEGLPARDGVHAGIAPDDEGLVTRAVALLRNPSERDRRRRAARDLVEQACAPDVALTELESVYAGVARCG